MQSASKSGTDDLRLQMSCSGFGTSAGATVLSEPNVHEELLAIKTERHLKLRDDSLQVVHPRLKLFEGKVNEKVRG